MDTTQNSCQSGSVPVGKSCRKNDELDTRLLDMIHRAIACASGHIHRVAGWWSSRLKSAWQQGSSTGDRLVAVGLFVAGIAAIILLCFLLIYLIPFLILSAVIAAVIANFSMNKDRFRRMSGK